jgi:hypothetical protein
VGTFKKDERVNNGLEAVREQLIEGARKPGNKTHLVVGMVTVKRVTFDAEDGIETPVVKFVGLEVVDGFDGAEDARKLFEKVHRGRTGTDLGPDLIDAAEAAAALDDVL